ncbi:MAG: hypothetical protein CMJ31_11465 [Phycisphaerae bacterium]|nr:hypothetical protein [Phycisphaerae bacterium]
MSETQPTPEANAYVFGTDDVETERLGLQHRLWSDAAVALWRRGGLAPGMTVLDLGCGPGHASFDMAQVVGCGGRVIGLDISDRFVAQFNARAAAIGVQNCRAYAGESKTLAATLEPELAAGRRIDAVYCRWMLSFVPDPEAVIAQLSSILEPGAVVMVQDYFNYESMTLAPRRPEMTRLVEAIAKGIRMRGGDPDLMGRLPRLLASHGFRIDHLDQLQRIARPGTSMWTWPGTFWRSVVPRLVATGLLEEAEAEAFSAVWMEVSADRNTFIHLPTVYETLATKA